MRTPSLLIILSAFALLIAACTSATDTEINSSLLPLPIITSNTTNITSSSPSPSITLDMNNTTYTTCTTAADCTPCEGCNNITCKQLGELPSYCSECATHDDCKEGYACDFKENKCVIAQRCDILDYLSGNNTCSAGFMCDNDVCVPSMP